MGGEPPEPPDASMPGRGRNLGFEGDEPTDDLLNVPSRATSIGRAQAAQDKLPAKLGQRLQSLIGRLQSEDVRTKVDPFVREARRLKNNRDHMTELHVTIERAILKKAGITAEWGEDGYTHMIADGRDVGFFDDVIERTSDAGKEGYASLTIDQKNALKVVGEHNRMYNNSARMHGLDPRLDPEIEGDYFGRRAIGREITTYDPVLGPDGRQIMDKVTDPDGTTRRVGRTTPRTVKIEKADQLFQSTKVGANRVKSRIHQSVEEAAARGVKFDDPWEARLAVLRAKFMMAEDAYLKESFSPLAVRNIDSTLGLAPVTGHPAFNGEYFPPDIAARIQKGLERAERGPLGNFASAINGVLTPLRASFDMSGTLQQGMRLWLTNPKAASRLFGETVISLGKADVYEGALLRYDQQLRELGLKNGITDLLRNDLRFTGDSIADDMLFTEGFTNRLGKLGLPGKGANVVVTKSNELMSRTLNLYRLEMAKNQIKRYKLIGLEGEELERSMKATMAGINRAFGWTASNPSVTETATVFAPRYFRAAIETLVKSFELGTLEGRQAREHMGLLLAEGAAVAWVINTMRGEETEFNPTDSNFLRIRDVGGVDVTLFGTYNTLFRAIARTAIGDKGLDDPQFSPANVRNIWRLAEGKMSPAMKLVYEPFIKGETYLGKPQDVLGDPIGVLQEQAKSTLPFTIQNLAEEGPVAAAIGFTGLSNTPLSPAERRDRSRESVAQDRFGMAYDDLSGAQKAEVNNDERVKKYIDELRDRAKQNPDSDYGRSAIISETVANELDASARFLEEGVDESGQLYSGNDFREAYNDTMQRAAGAREFLEFEGDDPEIDEWYSLYDEARMANGQINYEMLERLQAEFRSEHPTIDEKIEKGVGIYDNPAVRELREARKLAAEYYQIPAYRGMSVEEAEQASAVLNIANDLVAFGQARDRHAALMILRRAMDPAVFRLAYRAQIVGSNPARERFRHRNPLFAKYYSDIPGGLQLTA